VILVGPNGAGKSTESGTVRVYHKDIWLLVKRQAEA
jgi:ABC-type Mn2+/Zn2+ transport system ATPase subunit